MTATTPATPAGTIAPDDANQFAEIEVQVLTVELQDATGAAFELRIDAEDWDAALALTQEWFVQDQYGKPEVVSTHINAVMHPQRTWRDLTLRLANFTAHPAYGETVRHRDGSSLNMTRPNLVCRPKGAPLNPKPPTDRPLTLREERLEAAEAAIFAKGDVAAAVAAATATYKQRAAEKRAATRVAKRAVANAVGGRA